MATSSKASLSVVLITHDAAGRLARTLEAVSWADEILVVDSGSTDETVEIAERAGAKVVVQPEWRGFGYQKNFAVARTWGEWILILDADEVVDSELASEIRSVMSSGSGEVVGYTVQRVNYFCGTRLRFGRWRPHFLPRLFRKGHGRVSDDPVHERVIIEGPLARLPGRLHHYTSDSVADRIRKHDEYSTIAARVRFEAGRRVSLWQLLLIPPASLFRDLVLRLGLMDGPAGIIVAVTGAFYDFSKYAKIWELQRRAARGETLGAGEPTTPPALRRASSRRSEKKPRPSRVAGEGRGRLNQPKVGSGRSGP